MRIPRRSDRRSLGASPEAETSADQAVLAGLEPLGEALARYERTGADDEIIVHVGGEESEILPVAIFFRTPEEMDALEREALKRCRGNVLDVGAGAGAVSLALQERGLDVTALDILPQAVKTLKRRGVSDVVHASVWTFSRPQAFDTVLALMNGAALATGIHRLDALLLRLRHLVRQGGQLLMDSTDPLLEGPRGRGSSGGTDRGWEVFDYQLEYRGEKGPPFPQFFVSPEVLGRIALRCGWTFEVVGTDGPRYLARMEPRHRTQRADRRKSD